MKRTIEKHFKENYRAYIILGSIFILGIVIGVIAVNKSNDIQKSEIVEYLTNIFDNYKSGTVKHEAVFIKLIKDDAKLIILIILMCLSVFGTVGIFGIIGYEGFCLGYTISCTILTFGVPNGIWISFSTVILEKIIEVPAIILMSITSIKLYRFITKNFNKLEIKKEFKYFFVSTMISIILLGISAFFGTYIGINLLHYIM